jgi:hypothetical protein
MIRFRLAFVVIASLTPVPLVAQPADADHFERRIRPLLLSHCVKCHGPEKTRGGLRLDTADGLNRGGNNGHIVVPGKPDESLLLRAVRQVSDLKMPPDGKLTPQQIMDLETWVRSGGKWPTTGTGNPSSPSLPSITALSPEAGPRLARRER